MGYISIVFIAIALSIDALAVSISRGVLLEEYRPIYSFKFAIYFALAQFFMSYLGYYISKAILQDSFIDIYYLPAFLLFFVGVSTIFKANNKDENILLYQDEVFSSKKLVILSLSTSLDGLSVGISLGMLNLPINMFRISLLIASVSFIFSALGVRLGKAINKFINNQAEYFGGIVLILIGFKVILQNH